MTTVEIVDHSNMTTKMMDMLELRPRETAIVAIEMPATATSVIAKASGTPNAINTTRAIRPMTPRVTGSI